MLINSVLITSVEFYCDLSNIPVYEKPEQSIIKDYFIKDYFMYVACWKCDLDWIMGIAAVGNRRSSRIFPPSIVPIASSQS